MSIETSHEIRSSFVDDPDMMELVEMFVEDIPGKIEHLQQALAVEDLEQLRVFAHQLKGSAAGYGFAPLTDLARELETATQEATAGTSTTQAAERVLQYLAAIRL